MIGLIVDISANEAGIGRRIEQCCSSRCQASEEQSEDCSNADKSNLSAIGECGWVRETYIGEVIVGGVRTLLNQVIHFH